MNSTHTMKSKRLRRKPKVNYSTFSSTEEEIYLRQAINNSKLETKRPLGSLVTVPQGPTFFPTVEEFEGNPIHYIEKIRPVAEKYGICKIVPPPGWDPPMCVKLDSEDKIQTKDQQLHRIQEGISFGDGEEYQINEYIKMAQKQTKEWMDENCDNNSGNSTKRDGPRMSPDLLEQHYWDAVEMQKEYNVEYGNDVDTNDFGSGFPRSQRGRYVGGKESLEEVDTDLPEPKFGTDEFYRESYWNLSNIPNCPDSILHHIKVKLLGINVPWLYFGNLFSTFCWHNEDNYLYSINYHHWGAPKQWYGVPGSKKCAEGVEKVFKSYLSMKLRDEPDLLHHITTMFSPRLLQSAQVSVCKLLQHPGEFVVTFPRAFHGGFSMGPNIGEAVNFATHNWISHGSDASERYRSFARPAVFSQERLTFTMAKHLREQKSYNTCMLLLQEIVRLIKEEKTRRSELLKSGVRDVSKHIKLPRNRLDQLDEESADYDDKRLCFSCKHTCFLSCVACECSKSKVSCLRHSHFMCRCPPQRRYLMIWATEKEMAKTRNKVQMHLDGLKKESSYESGENVGEKVEGEKLSDEAPGSIQDSQLHKGYTVDLSPKSSILSSPVVGEPVLKLFKSNKDVAVNRDNESEGPDAKKMKTSNNLS